LNLDLNNLGQDILSAVQPLLSGAGSIVGTFASSAASFFGWTFFILLISYFILAESGGISNRLINLSIPGYAEDLQRLGAELSRIWNAFLRGQLTIVLLTILIYIVLLGSLGLKFFLGLALLAGLARFVPYVGPAVTWTSYGLVAFFQGTTLFGISPLAYVGVVVGISWLFDMILDNVAVPRIMSDALRVHPAAVMVSALIGANLLGVIGVVLAAPVLATVQLILDYVVRKLFDQDPWEGMQVMPPPAPLPTFIPNMQRRYEGLRNRILEMRRARSK
jgi:predicted PurR-regulated permease PerM